MTDSEKFDLILSKLENMDGSIQEIKSEVRDLRADMDVLKSEVLELKQRVTNTELVLDNEIRVNIQRVAEGHLDFSRNLHDAMKPDNEMEMLAVKVRVLESDVRMLKEKIS